MKTKQICGDTYSAARIVALRLAPFTKLEVLPYKNLRSVAAENTGLE